MASPGLIWLPGRLYGDFVGTATHFVRDEESRPRGAGRWKWYAYTVYVAGTRVKFRRKSELEQGVKWLKHTASSTPHRPTGQGGQVIFTANHYIAHRILKYVKN